MNVIKPSTEVKLNPTTTSTLETESLFGEFVEVIEQYKSWVFCNLTTDKYHGWIKKNDLGYLRKPTHRVLAMRTFIFKKKDIKSTYIHYL